MRNSSANRDDGRGPRAQLFGDRAVTRGIHATGVISNAGGMLHLCRKDGGGAVPTLFLHGSTLPASIAFCTDFGGSSYLDLHAGAGRDAWCLDFRGYGLSFRPSDTDGPVTSTQDAVSDVSAAVDYILDQTGAPQLDIVGWSWGSTVAAVFATRERVRLRQLVLIAPQWLRDTPSPLLKNSSVLTEAYRKVSPDGMVERWLSRLPETAADEIRQAGWDKSLRAALSDPDKGGQEAPNGPLVEIAERWSKGSPLYDPKEIKAPVGVIVGTDDTETPPANVRRLYAELTDHPAAFYLEIAGASHFVPIEPKRQRIVEFASAFLK